MQHVTPIQFFQAFFGEPVTLGQLMLWTRSSRGATDYTYWPNNLDEAARTVCQHRRSRDVYFGVALQNRQATVQIAQRRRSRVSDLHVRGSEDSATLLPALWAHLDVAGPGHSRNNLPPDPDAALGLLRTVSRPPSIVVNNGLGFDVYWLLHEPLVLATTEARLAARRLLERLQAALRSAATEHGWGLGGSTNLAQVMRVPGTLNHQLSPAAEVTVEHFPFGLGAGERGCVPKDFDDLPEPDAGDRLAALMCDLGALNDLGPNADFQRVIAGCPFLQYAFDQRSGLPEQEWEATLEVVTRCRVGDADGRRLGHHFSRDHPGYTMAGTDARIDRALATRGARTCAGISSLSPTATACCAGCGHAGRIEGPITLGQPAPPPPSLAPSSLAPSPPPPIELVGKSHRKPRTVAGKDPLRDLVGGMGDLLETLGGAASSREILDQLAAGRYPTLRSALVELFPNLQAETLPTPAQLSVQLGSMRGFAGGARIEQGPRNHKGVRWSIRRVEEASP